MQKVAVREEQEESATVEIQPRRPKTLASVVGIMVLNTLLGLVLPRDVGDLTRPEIWTIQLLAGFVTLFWLVFIRFLWLGRNWARKGVLGSTAFYLVASMLMLCLPGEYEDPRITRLFGLVELLFNIFLMFYLNKQSVRAYFRPKPKP